MIHTDNYVPCCSHPSTVVVVNSSDMRHVQSLLPKPKWLYRFYMNPIKALEFLEKQQQPTSLGSHWQRDQHNSNCFNSNSFDHGVRSLLQRAFDTRRHLQVSALVTSQSLFHISGAQLCERVALPHVQTLLLGPNNMCAEGISLMSQGKIHSFLDDSALGQHLEKTLATAQKRFFQSLSAPLYDLLFFFDPHHPLFDPAVAQTLENAVQKTGAAEFYLCGPQGDFIFITAKGEFTGFVVRSQRQIDALLNSQEAKRASVRVVESLQKGTHILCLPPKGHGGPIPVAQWQDHLYEAQTFQGKQTYRFACVPNWVALNDSFTPLAYCNKPSLPVPIDSDASPHLF
ncbi:MAG: hypothetical protein AAF320_04055 [Myxococcota bacterium]